MYQRYPLRFNLWHWFTTSLMLILGILMLLSAPFVEGYLRNQENVEMEKALKYFSQSWDIYEPVLPTNIENVELQSFEHLGHRQYKVMLKTDSYFYNGEILFGRLTSSVKEHKEFQMTDPAKILVIVGIVLAVTNIIWSFISHMYLQCTFYSLLEDGYYAVKRFFQEGIL